MENLQWGDFLSEGICIFLLKHLKHLKPSLDQSTSWFRAERRVNHSWCHHLYLKIQPKNGANCILMCFKLSGWHDTLIIVFPLARQLLTLRSPDHPELYLAHYCLPLPSKIGIPKVFSMNSQKKSLSMARKTKLTINQRFLCGDAYLGHPLL